MIKKLLVLALLALLSSQTFADATPIKRREKAENVDYSNVTYTTVDAALDHLLYVAPDVSSFTNNRNNVEIGTTITSTILNWANNKTMTSQSINQGIGSITPSLLTYTDNSSYSTNRTYTITVGDGTNTDQASTSITFLNKRYWGVSSNTSLNDAQIIALSSELATNNTKTFTVNPSAQRIWFCSPASFGTHSFTVNGFSNTDFTSGTQTHVNASGNSSSYRCTYSNNLLTGTFIVGVE